MAKHYNLLMDLDETLLDFHASEYLGIKEVLEKNGQVFSEELYDYFKGINKKLWIELEKGSITRPELFCTRFKLLFEKCGCDTKEMNLLDINSDFIDCMSRNGVPLDGAVVFLDKISQGIDNLRIYIVSNGATRNALGRIETTGMDKYFSKVFISESMGVNKPSKEFFDMVLNDIGDDEDSYLVIGDSLTSDMLGAKNAGILSCWFKPTGDIDKAVRDYDIDFTADSFEELYDVILKWAEVK